MSDRFTLALAGDTMFGRGVGERLATDPVTALFGTDLLAVMATADAVLLNLECCISERGEPWPGRVFHFRAPPVAVDALTLLGVDCVTLANNHALDYGVDALLDTIDFLTEAGIAVVGAGPDTDAARRPATVTAAGHTVSVVAFTDHPAEYAAGPYRPGVAYADIHRAIPDWLTAAPRSLADAAGAVIVTPHWGPNMTTGPADYIRRTADQLLAQGASMIAGHSAHVFHGVAGPVLYDLGDFIDDYATHAYLRNDLGLLWLATFDDARLHEVEAVPIHLSFCHTSLARGEDAEFIGRRLREASEQFATTVRDTERGFAIDTA